MARVYLDTNLYSYAAAADQAAEVRAMLDAEGSAVTASVLNLIELARTGDRQLALRLVSALTRVAQTFEQPPFTFFLAQEFVHELSRVRPEWLVAGSSLDSTATVARWQKKWAEISRSPDAALVKLPEFSALHDPLEAGLHEQQTQVAKVMRQREVEAVEIVAGPEVRSIVGDALADEFDAKPPLDRFVRFVSFEDWKMALFGKSPHDDVREWVRGVVQIPDEADLIRLWLRGIHLRSTPHHRVRALLRAMQPSRTVLSSNRNDLDQANWLLRCDVVLTADGRFCKLLAAVRDEMSKEAGVPPMARLGRVIVGPDVVASIRAGLQSAS